MSHIDDVLDSINKLSNIEDGIGFDLCKSAYKEISSTETGSASSSETDLYTEKIIPGGPKCESNQETRTIKDLAGKSLTPTPDKNYQFKIFKKIADFRSEKYPKGLPYVQTVVGYYYENLYNDPSQAFRYYLMAAEQDLACAICNLAICYANGIGTVEDQNIAFLLFRKASSLGSLNAHFETARYYVLGIGTTVNIRLAFTIFKLIADHKDYKDDVKDKVAESQFLVGIFYLHGNWVKKNEKMALEYFEKASKLGNIRAVKLLTERN